MLHTRALSGIVQVDGQEYGWTLVREPQWCTVDGFKGMLVEVRQVGAGGRLAVLQFPRARQNNRVRRGYRDRPQVQRAELERGVRSALSQGWLPEARGKPFHVDL